MSQWECTVLKTATAGFWSGGELDANAFQQSLNQLGAQGWELVSCFDTNQHHGTTRDVIAVLKRPV